MEARINGHTKLYALIGSPVGHSGSPAMQNYSFQKLGIDAAYLAFDVPLEKTKEALDALRTLHAGGFNVTMPCKTAVAQLVDRLSPAAELVGACNTVVIEEDGTMTGHITDGSGFVRNLREHGVEVTGKKIVLLGTGGAATAIAVQAALDGVEEIAIFNRKDEFYANGEKTVEKIKNAVPGIGKVYIEDLDNREVLKSVIAESDILVNATRAGMSPLDDVIPVPEEFLHKDLAVADVVYNPRETLLIRKAKEAGCRAAVGGIGMLLWQGAEAFKLFTGQEMPADEVMEKFFKE
ncbi:MAG TPA: shikimate dehydrogenase [Candidatus Mediterraneibacter colneyensis]|nr:shikimate dehydrogenase [Candidatus Mediterraneibacter colneyensis]